MCDGKGWVRLSEGGCPSPGGNAGRWSPLAKDLVAGARGQSCFVVPALFLSCVRVWGAWLGVPHLPQLLWGLQSCVEAVLGWMWALSTGKHHKWRGNSHLLK